MKAAALTQALDDERGGKPERITVSESDDDSDSHVKEFWELLGGKGPIADHDDLDDQWEDGHESVLYRVSERTGKLEVTEEARGKVFDCSRLFCFC